MQLGLVQNPNLIVFRPRTPQPPGSPVDVPSSHNHGPNHIPLLHLSPTPTPASSAFDGRTFRSVGDVGSEKVASEISQPTWWGFSAAGDEAEEGPVFNYARLYTWNHLVNHVRNGFDAALQGPDMAERGTIGSDLLPLDTFCSLNSIPAASFHHMFWSFCVATLLQWGTVGGAIFTAYNTPPIGLGCRSGSFLLYGIAGTTVWCLAVISSALSHTVMHHHEQQIRNPTMAVDAATVRSMHRLTVLAIVLRFLAKTIAIANAVWLFSFSILQDIGYFQNCWSVHPLFVPVCICR